MYLETGENKGHLQKPKNDIENYVFANKHIFNANNNDELHK